MNKFIVLEGIDGSGQDTQAELLKQALAALDYSVLLTHEPTNGPIGQEIRSILRGEKPHLSPMTLQQMMSQDRSWHLREEVEPHLKSGEIVISVRYYYSTLAYGIADGLAQSNLWEMNKNFRLPDIAIYLDLKPEIAMTRIAVRGKPEELFEKREFLTKVRNNFLELINTHPELKLVDADADIAAVHQRVMAIVNPIL